MATVNMALGGSTGHPTSSVVSEAYAISRTIDLADVIKAKGSALAAADVIGAYNLPANVYVISGGLEIVTAGAGGATAATLHLGDAADPDRIVTGADALTAGYTATATTAAHASAAAKTVNVTLATLTGGALTSGVIRVWLLLADISEVNRNPGNTF